LGLSAVCENLLVMVSDQMLEDLAGRLTEMPGVVGVLLGGSRARGDHTPHSDVDLGLYYRPRLDTGLLGELAREVAGPQAQVTEPGGWGPWVDGGAWLTIAGRAVDWIYRDLDRVHAAWRDAQRGRYSFHAQVGHPLGVPDFAYPGEVALGVILADPTGELAGLQQQTRCYPPRLSEALVQGMWEATFLIGVARKAVGRADTAYVAGCVFRIIGLCTHALHGHSRRWLINEKGAVASAGRLKAAPVNFAQRAQDVMANLGNTPPQLEASLNGVEGLVNEVITATRPPG
jgi:Nucleotidyltransferase domain